MRQHVYTFDLMMPELELKQFIARKESGRVPCIRTAQYPSTSCGFSVDITCLSLKRRFSGLCFPRLVRGSIGLASTAPGLGVLAKLQLWLDVARVGHSGHV